MADVAALLTAYGSLPEPRQPAWGLQVTGGAARPYENRLAAVLPLLESIPCEGPLRILDLECGQGYFTLAVAHALAKCGRAVEVTGIDRSEDNIRFCEALAAHHNVPIRFAIAAFGKGFVRRHKAPAWDVVLSLAPLQATGAVEGMQGEAAALLRKYSRVLLCTLRESPGDAVVAPRASGGGTVSGQAFHRRLALFPLHPSGGMQGLHVWSTSLAWLGEHWFEFDRIIDPPYPGMPGAASDGRRFFLGAQAVVKAFRGDGEEGDANRRALAAEADVLHALQGKPDRYPALLARADDGDVVWLAREALPGELLSERITTGAIDRDAVAQGLLAELVRLESLGFHHGDLRCWHCLVDGTAAHLIGFGALVRAASPLHRLALASMLLEIAVGEPGHESPFYASVHPVGSYPGTWQRLVRYLLGASAADFCYAEAHRILVASVAGSASGFAVDAASLEPADEMLSFATREQCEVFRRQRERREAVERALAGEERAHAAGVGEVGALRARVHELERTQQARELERVKYIESLRTDLDKSRAYATSLKARLDHEAADASMGREAMEAAQRAAVGYSDSLDQSLHRSRVYAGSLKDALEQSQAYASSLEARIEREGADARAEREAVQRAQREAAAHVETLVQQLDQSQAYATSLEVRIGRQEVDDRAEREAVQRAQQEAAIYAASLAQQLDQSQAYATSLEVRIERQEADARAEREALQAGQRESDAWAESLEQSLAESQAFSDSLNVALTVTKAYATSLEARVEREGADARVEREALQAAQRDAAAHADSLAQALRTSQEYADSLRASLDASQAYATSLEGRVEKEAADARIEREALQAAQRDAAVHADSLEQALRTSQEYADSLRAALDESHRFADSLRVQREQDAATAAREQAALADTVSGWRSRHERLQRRFRLLRFLWPREPGGVAEPGADGETRTPMR